MNRALTRRAFLCSSGAALAAGGLARVDRSPEEPTAAVSLPRDRRCKKALKIGMVQIEGSLAEKFALLRRLGFDGVELDSPNDLKLEDVLAARDASGLEIEGVVDSAHWSKPFSHPDPKVRAEGVAALETALRDAKAYGASSVLVVPGVVGKEVGYADAYRRSQEEIRKVLPLANELGVRIAFENVWNNFLLSPLEMARYVDEFGDPLVGVHLDPGNLVRSAWPEHWIEVLGKRIQKVDVKDYSRKKLHDEGLWKGFDVEIGDGDTDWPAVMKALDAVGYEGWFAAEVAGGGEARLKEIAVRMDRIFAS
ncbi:MAG: sugar phosphate isomerase/epimerase [Planctomycetes bacterium]|nr:sugar phosphate isomerase/epimerase [Planctomycetota bacterium]